MSPFSVALELGANPSEDCWKGQSFVLKIQVQLQKQRDFASDISSFSSHKLEDNL